MNKIGSLTSLWKNVGEADLRPFRDQALAGVRIAIVGEPGSGRAALADQMRRDPNRPQLASDAPVLTLDLESASQAATADLIILLIPAGKRDISRERALVQYWQNHGQRALVFINQDNPDQVQPSADAQALSPSTVQPGWRVISGSVSDTRFLVEKFVPAVIELVPGLLLALGRYFPLFRLKIAHFLINDTSFSNAAYAMSTGLAELVAVLDLPITIADTIVLTKSQAFLVYKLGLALGYSTNWKDYVAEFGGVLGGGFVWRNIARSLVGLIPLWGIIPKTAIAYAGTYVVGNVVLQWYLTGKHLSKPQMRQLYSRALEQGRALARTLAARMPRPRLRLSFRLPWSRRPRLSAPADPQLPAPQKTKPAKRRQVCPNCGKTNSRDARFCQYCGTAFN
ncbi:MAG: hypothetical protein B6D39_08680 [Anaerolineae bacterium UTCFX2]|jgi:uncharacterized protein (DUF697 family)|nr:zinc ribbon domain-containing protein [Anaerolineae bacterium]MCZ7551755.1 zinc ribbon domain-containing protein [Anaerolineales bacterium]OQY90142.1 MAG: hypothetical protein B6D39_08680 [Anaerolineae bacterium UTCFX2]